MSTRVKTRVRTNFGRTQKDGWVPEFTIEVEWDGEGTGEEQDEEGLYRLGLMSDEVQKQAFAHCDKMNRMEGRESVWQRYPLSVDTSTGEIVSTTDQGSPF